jgi:hypothetical protein
MPSNIQYKIASILPPSGDNGSDEQASVGGNNNEYSVGIMYENICAFDQQNINPTWSKIWSLNVIERVRYFVWLLAYDRLLTNYRKSRMGLGHAMCNHCGNVAETTLHVMRDCSLVTPFLLQVVPMRERSIFFMEDLQQWIATNIGKRQSGSNGGAWCDIWATACHCIWTWRNKETHNNNYVRPLHMAQHVYKVVEDYSQAMRVNEMMRNSERVLMHIGWQPPSGHFVKLNTDGACKENNRAGCGGIIRGNQGEWLGGFAKGVGVCSAFVAELWGVLEGLQYARRLRFMAVELNIDSVTVVQVIKTGKLSSPIGLP